MIFNWDYTIIHDKFIVVKGKWNAVESCSFSFTSSALARNVEAVVLLRDPRTAPRYGQERSRLWAGPKPLEPRY
jgi:hypothetical protein